MAIIHTDATLEPGKAELVAGWITGRRWYRGAGRPDLEIVASIRLDDPAGEVGIETLLLQDGSGGEPVLYQVPLTYRSAPLPGADDAALVGEMQHSVLGRRYVYDAPHDPVYVEQLLRTVVTGGREAERSDGRVTGTCRGSGRAGGGAGRHRPSDEPAARLVSHRVSTAEQSNTSVAAEVLLDGTPASVMTKLFRVVQEGPNPDVELLSALADAGCDRVPGTVGSLRGGWTAPDGRTCEGDLALCQELLTGVRDGWARAVAAAAGGTPAGAAARELGAAVAQVHARLAEALGTEPAGADEVARIVAGMRERLEAAVAVDPALQAHRPTAEAALRRAERMTWPRLQRVHGDLHLGQVLEGADGRGWVLIDFEGEPLRPLPDRRRPDTVLRDLAGMLRSFDYAAATAARDSGATGTDAWAAGARQAFLAGYAAAGGPVASRHASLLQIYELDKALYEMVYETSHRPGWVDVPRTAVERLTGALERQGEPVTDEQHPTTGEGQPHRRTGATRILSPAAVPPAGEEAVVSTGSTGEGGSTDEGVSTGSTGDRGSADGVLPLDPAEADALLAGLHRGPHGILGAHPGDAGVTVRVLRPLAERVELVLAAGRRVPLRHEHRGIWVGLVPGAQVPDYRVAAAYADGVEHVTDDPYRFLPTLGDLDLHLIGEGRHEQLWTVLGANPRSYPGELGEVHGTAFAVWAPHARAVQLIGDMNGWDGAGHSMRVLGGSGVWELFVPGTQPGQAYKFNVLGADGVWRAKADPLARQAQTSPETASVIADSQYEWGDEQWLRERPSRAPHASPMSVYEVHLGSWRPDHGYRDLAEHLVNYVKDLGFTHVELMPVMEHPYPPSWGYHVTGYYAPSSRLGSPDDFRALVDRLHQEGIGVILDWVPGHFATDDWALARFDGTPLYEHPDPRRGWHPDWGSYIFDFGRPQVRNFLVANAIYWCEEFHIDGLRIDAVASMLYLDYSRGDGEWLPNEHGGRENLEAISLLQETNATVYRRVPGVVTIAEESTAWPGVTAPTDAGGLGFGLKWNMGWMHDSLAYFSTDPVHRRYHHHLLTFGLTYAFSENYLLPVSHDEVVHGKGSLLRKMPGERSQELDDLRAYLGFMWSHPGKQLIFMGVEIAQESEWSESRGLDWWLLDQPAHLGVHRLVKDLNRLYLEHPALWRQDSTGEGFRWLEADDADGNTYAYLRLSDEATDRPVAVVLNLSGTARQDLLVGLPQAGTWREVLNTDGVEYGGSGEGNLGEVEAVAQPHAGQPCSARVTLGPRSAVWLVPQDAPQPGTTTLTTTTVTEAPAMTANPTGPADPDEPAGDAQAPEAAPTAEVPESPETDRPLPGTPAPGTAQSAVASTDPQTGGPQARTDPQEDPR